MATYFNILPLTSDQSPACQLSSMAEITFCIKIDGIELTTALKTIQQRVNGKSTG